MSTNTEVIDFGDDFTDAFTINLNTVYFNENSDYNIEFSVPSNDEFDEDTEMYYVTKIKLINIYRLHSLVFKPTVSISLTSYAEIS